MEDWTRNYTGFDQYDAVDEVGGSLNWMAFDPYASRCQHEHLPVFQDSQFLMWVVMWRCVLRKVSVRMLKIDRGACCDLECGTVV
jgi:hypothetical protein